MNAYRESSTPPPEAPLVEPKPPFWTTKRRKIALGSALILPVILLIGFSISWVAILILVTMFLACAGLYLIINALV